MQSYRLLENSLGLISFKMFRMVLLSGTVPPVRGMRIFFRLLRCRTSSGYFNNVTFSHTAKVLLINHTVPKQATTPMQWVNDWLSMKLM